MEKNSRFNVEKNTMRFKGINFGVAEALEVGAVTGYFVGLTLLLILWQPGSAGCGFLIHLLTLFCLGAAVFSLSFSGYKIRRPFSFPEILLLIVFIYELINAILSRVPFASWEMLPFFLDGLILFYVGTILFARRHEGFILTMLIFILGFCVVVIFSRYGDIWKVSIDPGSVYRGKKMLIAATFEHPFWGCGNGALSFLNARYLPLGDRYPPFLNPVFARFLTEHGFIGAAIWIIALAGMISCLFPKEREKKDVGKLKRAWFWIAVIIACVFLFSGFLSLSLSLPFILYGFLPLCGTVYIRGQGKEEPVREGENQFRKRKLRFSLGIGIPIFIILLLEMSPLIAASLISFKRVSELGTTGYERRIGAARLLMPYNPEIHIMQAKHFRAKASGDPRALILPIELAYLRALGKNPYNERYYLEYAHFLDLARDYSGMVSTLEKGAENCPGSVEIRMFLFRGYMNTGDRRKALDVLSSLRGFYPLDSTEHERLAKYYAEAGALAASNEERILALQLSSFFTREK